MPVGSGYPLRVTMASMMLQLFSLLGVLSTVSAQLICRIDMGFVVDESGSIRDTNPRGTRPGSPEDNWQKQIEFIKTIVEGDRAAGIDGLTIGREATRVGLVTFGNNGKLHWDLDDHTDLRSLVNAIENLQYRGGNTNTTGGLMVAREQMFSPTGGDRRLTDNIMILLSDGEPTRWVDQLFPYAESQILGGGIRVIGVGVTNAVKVETFQRLVSSPFEENYFSVENFDELQGIISGLIESACRTQPPPPSTTPQPGECENEADIFYLVDASGSIRRENFAIVREFLMDLTSRLHIDSGRIQLGMATFASRLNEMWGLSDFRDRGSMMDRIAQTEYTRGSTNTAAAIRYLRETAFSSSNGNRDDAPDIAMILTDGNSNEEEDTIREAYLAKQQGIHIITIAVGNWLRHDELETVASYPKEVNAIRVEDFEDLLDNVENILDLLCNNEDNCRRNPCDNGECADGIGIYWCRCEEGWAGRNCDQRCREPTDLGIALDMSGSIELPNFRKEVDFIRELVYGINVPEHQLSLATFGTEATMRFSLDEYESRASLMDAIGTMYYSGGTTNTGEALTMMKDELFGREDRRDEKNVGVILTDGRSNNPDETWQEAMKVRNEKNAFMIAIGVGNNVRNLELEGIASEPTMSNVFRVENFDSFEDIQEAVTAAVCNQVNDCEDDPCRNGGDCIDLIGGFRCECSLEWTGFICDIGDSGVIDVAFVFDASGSIRSQRFLEVIEHFAVAVETSLEVRPDKIRVAGVRWSNDAEVNFYLNTYNNRQDVAAAIRRMRYMSERTHTADALRMLREEVFIESRGAREEARRVVIVVTDGNSNINPEDTIPEAILAHVQGIQVVVFAIGTDLNMLELNGIASYPDRHNFFRVDSYEDIVDEVPNVIAAAYNTEDECRSRPCENSGQCVDEVGYYRCECRNDWAGRDCDRRCTRRTDLALVLDLSGSIEVVYDIIIAFAEEIIHGLPVSLDRTNIGMISYQDSAQINFLLNQYQTKRELIAALAFQGYGGQTNTQEALRLVYRNMYTSRAGDRSGVDNKVILITDGRSNVQASNTLREATNVKNRDIELYVVAVGDDPDMGEINGIASDPDTDYVVRVSSPNDVQDAASELLDRLCE